VVLTTIAIGINVSKILFTYYWPMFSRLQFNASATNNEEAAARESAANADSGAPTMYHPL
jgi:hypothetical protein